jgi:hypothetical protein
MTSETSAALTESICVLTAQEIRTNKSFRLKGVGKSYKNRGWGKTRTLIETFEEAKD